MFRLSTVTSLLVTTLLVAGCGGGGENEAAVTTLAPAEFTTTVVEATTTLAPTTTVPAATTTAAPAAAAVGPEQTAKAAAAVLQPADFPPGWKALGPDDPGLLLETLWADLTRCLGVAPAQTVGIATSPTFLRGLATQARTTVEYMPAAAATTLVQAISGPKFQGCATSAFAADALTVAKRDLPGATPGPVTIAPLNAPKAAPQTSAFRITFTMNLAELQVPISQDLHVIVVKGAVIRALFLNNGGEFPQDLERSLVQKVVARA